MSEMGGGSGGSDGSGGSGDSFGSADAPVDTGEPSGTDGQTAGATGQPPPGKASAPDGGGPPPATDAPKPAEPGKASAPAGDYPHFDVAAALRNAETQVKVGQQSPAMTPAWERWLQDADMKLADWDAKKLAEPGKATAPAGADAPRAPGTPKPAEPGKATEPPRGDWHYGGLLDRTREGALIKRPGPHG
jgi:hypothetical protein